MSSKPVAVADPTTEESGPDRRSVMKAAAIVAVPIAGAGAVAACSSGSSGSSQPGSGGSGNPAGQVAVAVASVPVGGGAIVNGVVVTQPTAGSFKAFSAVCTHAGCLVTKVEGGEIVCPCHQSHYSAKDGSVISGPAPSPLTTLTAKVNGANVDVTGLSS
jgi:Rieske Fe-S protein